MRHQLIVSLEDLRRIAITCDKCGATVTLDMGKKSALAIKHSFFAPKTCPGCAEEFDRQFTRAVDFLQHAWEDLMPASGAIAFHVSPEADEKPPVIPPEFHGL